MTTAIIVLLSLALLYYFFRCLYLKTRVFSLNEYCDSLELETAGMANHIKHIALRLGNADATLKMYRDAENRRALAKVSQAAMDEFLLHQKIDKLTRGGNEV